MMEDDEFFEVTNHDVEHLLRRMSGCYPRADIIKMRKKYDLLIDDLEKKFMTKLALDYDHHIITRGHREPDSCHLPTDSSTFYVNGYTEKEWLMLTDEKFLPSQRELTRFMNHCKKTSDSGALEILQLKYGHIYEEWKRKTLEKNGLDKDTPCQSLSGWNIDGVTFFRWKLLHDPHFTPKTMGLAGRRGVIGYGKAQPFRRSTAKGRVFAGTVTPF